MKLQLKLAALLAAGWGDTQAAPSSTDPVAANRVLMIDPSSMPVGAGKATLTIGALQRANGVSNSQCGLSVSYREALSAAAKQP
jgi:hypothetical protein